LTPICFILLIAFGGCTCSLTRDSLLANLDSENPGVVLESFKAIETSRNVSHDDLEYLLGHGKRAARIAAILSIGKRNMRSAYQILLSLLLDEDVLIRISSAISLCEMGCKKSIPILIDYINITNNGGLQNTSEKSNIDIIGKNNYSFRSAIVDSIIISAVHKRLLSTVRILSGKVYRTN